MNHPKAMLQRFLPLLCAALLLAASFFPYEEKRTRLRIATGVCPATEALIVASDLQILPPERFQVIEIPWSSAVTRAFGSGAAEVAVMTLDSVLRMREAGQKLRVLMVLSRSAGGDAVLARQEFRQMQDLRGKRVGVERSAGSYLLANALEDSGMTIEEIEAVPMFQSEMEQALQTNQVDAVVASDPWLAKLSHQGTHSLYDSTKLKAPILHLIVASERACTSSRAELVALLKIQNAMTERIRAGNSFSGMDAVLRREALPPEDLAAGLQRLQPVNEAENAALLKQLPELALQMEEQMLRNGILTTKPVGGEWIDRSFTKEVFH